MLDVTIRGRRPGTRPLAIAALAALLAGGTVLGAGEARASVPAAGEDAAQEVRTCEGESFALTAPEYESLKLHNEARAGAGLGHLCVNPELTEAARAHATDMLEREFFSHDTPDGKDPIARMEAAGYSDWSSWGENIGWGSGSQGDAGEVFADLMNSPGHRENILKDGFLEVGVGAVGGEFEGRDDAAMYAMDFGSRDGQQHEQPEASPAGAPPEEGAAPEAAPEETAPEETTPPEEQPQSTTPEEVPEETAPPQSPEITGGQDASPQGEEDPEGTAPEEEAPDGGEVTPPDQEDPLEETPEPGESAEEEEREIAGAQQAICEAFGESREGAIANLRDNAGDEPAEDAGEGVIEGEDADDEGLPAGDLASKIIAETNSRIADAWEEDFLNPSFCGFGGDPEAGGEGDDEAPEWTTEDNSGGGGSTVVQRQRLVQRTVDNQNGRDGSPSDPETDGAEGAQPGGETPPEETVPEETVPEETTPEETVPEEPTPEDTSGGPR